MPDVKPGETEKEYISRCIPFVLNEGTTDDSSQAAAICHSLWDKHQKGKAVWLTVEEVKALCPSCAERMKAKGLARIRVDVLGESLGAKAGNIENLATHLANKYGEDPGFWTKCDQSEELADYDEDTRAAICARAHYIVTGKWPGEKSRKFNEAHDERGRFASGEGGGGGETASSSGGGDSGSLSSGQVVQKNMRWATEDTVKGSLTIEDGDVNSVGEKEIVSYVKENAHQFVNHIESPADIEDVKVSNIEKGKDWVSFDVDITPSEEAGKRWIDAQDAGEQWGTYHEGKSRKVGARHNQRDMRALQDIHDAAITLGAACPPAPAQEEIISFPLGNYDKALVYFGDAVKALGDGKVGGYLVRFTSDADPDITGEFFTKETDFGDLSKADVYYQHGMDEKIGKRKLGKGEMKPDDVGVWIEAQLNLRDEYEKAIYSLAEKGKLGWSSGTASHLVDREQKGEAQFIKAWPLGLDASLTPTPAEPRNSAIPLKSYLGAIQQSTPEAVAEGAGDAPPVEGEADIPNSISKGESKMELTQEQIDSLTAAAGKAGADAALKSLPTVNAAGVQVIHDEADTPFTQLGEELAAVQVATLTQGRTLDPRLKRLDIKQLGANELIGSEGGFLLEPTFAQELLKPIHEEGPFSSRVRKFPIGPNSNSLSVNAVDESNRATGSRWGGIQGYRLAEAGTKQPSQPTFRRMDLRLKKFAALCYATDEMLADSTALASVVQQGCAEELSFMVNDDIFTGPGAAGPQGIMDSGALVTVAAEGGQLPATIVTENIYNMWARLHPRSKANAVWFINTDCWPQLFGLNQVIGLSGVPMFMLPGSLPNTPSGSLLGRPIIESEFNETLGTVGDIVLADMSQYILIEKGGVQQASSIHVQFTTDQTVFRFVYRCDGVSSWAVPLTPYKGTGNTQSPFVALATR